MDTGDIAGPSLILVRHGQTAHNAKPERFRGHANIPLNATGRRDAAEVADALKDVPVYKIYASDLDRAAYTAKQIALEHSASPKVVTTKSLRPWDVGRLSGEPANDANIQQMKLYMNDTPQQAIPGGEAFNGFLYRYISFLRKVVAEVRTIKKPIVLVAHTRNQRAALGWLQAGMRGYKVDMAPLNAKEELPPGQALVCSFERNGCRVDNLGMSPGDTTKGVTNAS